MVVGVVSIEVSGRAILPPTTLTHLMLGLVTSSSSMVTVQMREYFCPASVEPVVVMDTTGSGRAGGCLIEVLGVFNTCTLCLTCDVESTIRTVC